MGIITYGEWKAKKSSDLFTNVAITAIVVIVCVYNFISTKFDFTKIATYVYIVVLLLAGFDVFLYIKNNKKYAKLHLNSKNEETNESEKITVNEVSEELTEETIADKKPNELS